jgi:hypothetical protein
LLNIFGEPFDYAQGIARPYIIIDISGGGFVYSLTNNGEQQGLLKLKLLLDDMEIIGCHQKIDP